MFGKYIHSNRCKGLIATAFFGILLTACVDDNRLDNETVTDIPTIQIRLSTDDLTTRTTTGESAFIDNEKKMNEVYLYFFSEDASETSTSLKKVHFTDKKHDDVATITIPADSISVIFGTVDKCRMYAVVNVSSDEFEAAGVSVRSPTLKQLRELRAKTTSFAEKFKDFAMFTRAETGDEIIYNPTTREAQGEVKVKNLASKIDIFVNFGDEKGVVEGIDPTGTLPGVTKWKIYKGTSNEAYLINGVQSVPLNGWTTQDYSDNALAVNLSGDDYFDTRSSTTNHYFDTSEENDKDKYPWVIAEPFYSYPNQWTNDPLEQHQTYLMVKVNWLPYETYEDSPNAEDEIVETYYKVPINITDGATIKSKDKLLSNVYYRVKININTLGGINYGEPVELECSWEALPWGESRLDAEIHEIRWLDVPQEQVDVNDGKTYTAVMYNTSKVTIPYNSTHKIELDNVKISYWIFNKSANSYEPVKKNALRYRTAASKNGESWCQLGEGGPAENDDAGINRATFTLDDTKLAAYEAEPVEKNKEPQGIYIDETNNTITIYHSPYGIMESQGRYFRDGIKNYSPYEIVITLRHSDDPSFKKEFTIMQYPGVYVEFTRNTGRNDEGVSIGRRVSSGSGTGSQERFGIYVNGGATNTLPGSLGSIFSANNPSNCLQLGGIGGQGLTNNQNLYAIHVTQLTEDEILRGLSFYDGNQRYTRDVTFHVGDPRTKFFNNNLEGAEDLEDVPHDVNDRWSTTSYDAGFLSNASVRNAFRKKPATEDEGGAQRLYPAPPSSDDNTTLCYYYPTAEGQMDEQAFMIAPVFRLASGKADLFQANSGDYTSDNLIRENARRRCAAFQENGYPAGRWRLPTIGELYFFRMLYNKGILPAIFNTERAYWTAQYVTKLDFERDNANIRPYPKVSDLNEKHVRCVYDDWYWKKGDGATPDLIQNNADKIKIIPEYYNNESIKEMFVWGDREKNNPQQQPQD